MFEKAFRCRHIELSGFRPSLSTVHEEARGEGSLPVCCGVAMAEHFELGVVPDGFLDPMETEFASDSVVVLTKS